MKDVMGLMKQAQAMQAKFGQVQSELEQLQLEGQSGGGMVKAVISGKGELKSLTIDPSLLVADEKEILEDLIVTAHEDARRKVDAAKEDKMKALTAGLPLPPGMKLPF
jgi:DNA-binding YbaB/EbfC family protein